MFVDMHTHAGRPRAIGAVSDEILATMRPAGVDVAVVSAVPDMTIIRRDPRTRALGQVREPALGECLATARTQLDEYEACAIRIAREPADLHAGDPCLVLAVEGCDFLEGDLSRLDEMATRGVRSIQLVHYVINETGDIQTSPPVHGGLTPFGRDAVRRMNELGVIVDVAHCTEATAMGVGRTTTKPILCTHANLAWPDKPDGGHLRFISPDYARMVADTGGVIGGWIAVLTEKPLPGMIDHIMRLVDLVGIDHVGVGTDMPAGTAATEMPDFARHPEIPRLLREKGLSLAETDKVCGGNWCRVFAANRE